MRGDASPYTLEVHILTQVAPENRLLHQVPAEARLARSAFIAIAFVRERALRTLLSGLHKMLERGYDVSFYTTGYMRQTERKALQTLVEFHMRFPKLRVFFNRSTRFHAKFLYFGKPYGYSLFVGSSNISTGGLLEEGELNIVVRGKLDDNVDKEIDVVMDNIKRDRNFGEMQTQEDIGDYREKKAPKGKRDGGQGDGTGSGRRLPLVNGLRVVIYDAKYTQEQEDKVRDKHPHWRTYGSYGQWFHGLKNGDPFLVADVAKRTDKYVTVAKYLEHDRVNGVGEIARYKEGKFLGLNKATRTLSLTEKALLKLDGKDLSLPQLFSLYARQKRIFPRELKLGLMLSE